jgi:hypothetical protein
MRSHVARGYWGRVSPLIGALLRFESRRKERITAPAVTGKESHARCGLEVWRLAAKRGQSPIWSMLCMPTCGSNPTFSANVKMEYLIIVL